MMTIFQLLMNVVAQAAPPPTRRARRSDLFEDTPVTNQFGQRFAFRTDLVADRAVIINTMYSVCRGSCPVTNATLKRLRQPLSELFGQRVSILSLSLDPEHDTPTVLREYAEVYGAGQPAASAQCAWHFLACPRVELEKLRRSLGFFDLDPRLDKDVSRHAALLLFGNDATNRWATSPAQLRAGLIFEPLRRILGVSTEERFGIRI